MNGRKRGRARHGGAVVGVCLALLAAGCASARTQSPGNHGAPSPSAQTPRTSPAAGQPDTAAVLARGHWSVLATSPLGPQGTDEPVVAWTGRDLLEIGGWGRGAIPVHGAAFNPADGRWRRIASAPVLVGSGAASAWTGSRLFVFGGQVPDSRALGPATLYDPVSNRWTVTAPVPFGRGMSNPAAVWTGQLIVAAAVVSGRLEVASYDPVTDRWRRQDPPLPAAHPAMDIAMVATASRVIVWSMWGRMQQTGPNSYTGYSGVDVLALAGSYWRDVTGGWPQNQSVPPPVFSGGQILIPPGQIWCGACSHPFAVLPGMLADPNTLRVTPLPRGPLDETSPVMVWTGDAALAINIGAEIGGPVKVRPGDMAAWDPVSRTWRRLPSAPEPLQGDVTWTGHGLLATATNGALLSFSL